MRMISGGKWAPLTLIAIVALPLCVLDHLSGRAYSKCVPNKNLRQNPRGRMEGGITQDNHALFELPNEPLKGVIRDISGGTRPPHDQPPLIEEQTEFAPDNPAMIGEPFAADLLGAPALAHRVDQLDAIRGNDAEHG